MSKGKHTTRPNPWPKSTSANRRVLDALLAGDKITPMVSIYELNCFTISSRVSELRALGWPIRALETPHPNASKFPDATLPCYVLDDHFRHWASGSENGTHPLDYPFEEGRGKFERKSFDD